MSIGPAGRGLDTTRRVPIVPTILVVIAVAAMFALGVWQLRRAEWKRGLLERYSAAEKMPPIAWPTVPLGQAQLPLFRHSTGLCLRPAHKRAIAGENLAGEGGYVQIVDCATGAEGPGMSVELGWSKDPNAKFTWPGGLVSGIIVPDRLSRMRLVAAGAPPGLEQSAPPTVASASAVSPAGHRGYAATWFALAFIAVAIYGLAIRKRLRLGAAK
ncbi:MAG: SURF1 family cytochrome oxidase biogenesis protein [Sphingomicrobium sp.]